MIKLFRKLFGLCDHEWEHATNLMTLDGPYEGLVCKKCYRMLWRHWS